MKISLSVLIWCICFSSAWAQSSNEKKEEPSVSKYPEYSRPLYFSVVDNELKVKNPQVAYDLKKSKGQSLEIGGVVFDNSSFTAKTENDSLVFAWNPDLVSAGDLSIINQQGKEIWRDKVSTPGSWTAKNLKGDRAPQWKNGERFRFCLRSEVGKGYSSLCSQWYGVEIKDSHAQIGPTKSEATARVIFQNEERKLEGAEEVAIGDPVQFLATLNTDATYEFVSEPLPLQIKDMIQAEDENAVTIMGELPKPLKVESKIVPGEDNGGITKFFGFEKTIAAAHDLWQADVQKKEARLTMSGKSGGVFTYKLEITDPPKKKDRRFISTRAPKGTYLTKDEMPVKDGEDDLQTWEFSVPEKFAFNTIYLEVPGEKMTHKSYLDIYRGSSGEASIRLTGVVTSEGDNVIMGEGHFAWWFNDLFGWQNYYLSRQRWGFSARYFTSLSKLPAKNDTGFKEDIDLKVAQADLRYRFSPGLWEKDESLGLIVAYEAMTIGSMNVPKTGVGLFWARSMPRSIDSWFSKLPFMNYPKWVDMEFIKYVSSTDSDISLGEDYVVNFHGKVLWTPRFFGEAGFGSKNYYFEKKSDGTGAKLTTFYATVGVGLNF